MYLLSFHCIKLSKRLSLKLEVNTKLIILKKKPFSKQYRYNNIPFFVSYKTHVTISILYGYR